MGYFGSGFVQGWAQGQAINEERAARKQQLDLAKKRFDLEEKERNFQMEQMKKQMSALANIGLFGGGGGAQDQTQQPSMTMPQAGLNLGTSSLQSSPSGLGPQGFNFQMPQMKQAQPMTPSPNQNPILNQLGALAMTGFNVSPLESILERQGRIPPKPSTKAPRELSPELQFMEEFRQKNPDATVADALTAYKKLDVENKIVQEKAPLPTTDKGYTIQFDPKLGVNVAAKGKIREEYDPDKHGVAVSTSETPLQRELEKGLLSDKEAGTVAQGIAQGRIAPSQLMEVGGGFGQVGNVNRGKIVKSLVKIAPKFGWKNADVLYKYQTNPQVFMGIVNVNAVRPRVEALRSKFSAIKNLDFLPANAAKNAINKMFGNDGIVDFESNRTQVVFELQRALTGIGMMSDSRIQQELNNLNSSYSPGQMNKAIDNINEILDVRLGALQAGPFAQPGMEGGAVPLDDYLKTHEMK